MVSYILLYHYISVILVKGILWYNQDMKKLILLVILLLILGGCFDETRVHVVSTVSTIVEDSEKVSGFNNIVQTTPREFVSVYDQGGSGIFLFGGDDCTYCDIALPLINEAASEYGLTVYYIDTSSNLYPFVEYDDEIIEILYDVLESDEKGQKVLYMPMLVSIENGRIGNYHIGLLEHEYNANDDDRLISIYQDVMESFR